MESTTLKPGDRAPEFSLVAADGEQTFSLRSLLAEGPLVVEFLRGTWWPNCVKRKTQLESLKTSIEKHGASLVYIAAQRRGGLFAPEKYLQEHPVSFPFLLDEDRRVTKEYGVYHRIGLDAYDIARPATFVIAKNGKITYIHVGASQTDRSPVEEVLAAIGERRKESAR
jgi:peroxiredoxin